MSKNLIDTNLIIRFLLNDDPRKAIQVEKLLTKKENVNLLLDTVIAEIVWVLGSHYKIKKSDIIDKITALIHLETIDCNELLISKALSVWGENNISYIDAYLAAVTELGDIVLYSYDKQFTSVPNIKVLEP